MSTSVKRVSFGTRLVVQIDGTELFPIQDFDVPFLTNNNIIDALDDGNIGYSHEPNKYTFSVSVLPLAVIGSSGEPALQLLNRLALTRQSFTMTITAASSQDFPVLAEAEQSSGGWAYNSVTLRDCTLDGGGLGRYDNSGRVEAVVVRGKALGIALNDGDEGEFS